MGVFSEAFGDLGEHVDLCAMDCFGRCVMLCGRS